MSRRPGRPRKPTHGEHARGLSTDGVIACAYRLCESTRLEDLTFDRIAEELDVSTTTVRHHIKNRKALTAALIECYFEDVASRLNPPSENWQAGLDNLLWAQMSVNLSKPGIVSYLFEHRFAPEIDPFGGGGAAMLTRTTLRILRAAGLNNTSAALAWHMILHLLLSVGYAEARGQTPAEQRAVFERIGSADPANGDSGDRAVVAALSQVNLPLIFGVVSDMLKHAIAVNFDFASDPTNVTGSRSD